MSAPLDENIIELPPAANTAGHLTRIVEDGSHRSVSTSPVPVNTCMRPSQVAGTRGSVMTSINNQLRDLPLIAAAHGGSNTNLPSRTSSRMARILPFLHGSNHRIHPQQQPVEGIRMQPMQHRSTSVMQIEEISSVDDDQDLLVPHEQQQYGRVVVLTNDEQNTVDYVNEEQESRCRAEIEEHLRSLPQNTNSLRDRLEFRRNALHYLQLGEEERHRQRTCTLRCCETFRHITWPRLKNQLKNILSYRLWRGHLKQVECHFGSSVASYFIFLRWLFFMNILIFVLWFCVVCVPQILVYGYHGLDRTDMTSCAYEVSMANNLSNISCSRNESSLPVYYYTKQSISTDDSCSNQTFTTHSCLINSEGIAYRQNKTKGLTLYSTRQNCLDINSPQDAFIVCYDVQTHYEWYEYILDFVTGSGIYNQTILFYGAYSFEPFGFFQFDLAFILMIGIIYILSIILLVHKMGYAYNESYSFARHHRQLNFSNKLYSAWDFNITEKETARLRRAYNRTNFLEESSDARSRETTRSLKKKLMIYFIRFWTNAIVLVLLVGAGVAIYFSTEGQLKLQQNREIIDQITDDTAREIVILLIGYLTSIVISILNVVYPFVFNLIAIVEYYKTASTRVSMTLIRTILVRLSSLLLLLFSLYGVVSQCHDVSNDYNTAELGECSIDGLITRGLFSNSSIDQFETPGNDQCPECWETYIGQQFFKLALLNMIITVGTTIFIETGRNFLSRCVKKMDQEELMGKYLGKIVKRGHFNIPKSILDLIYTQTLMWLGFLFSPLLPLIVMITSFVLFYSKKISLIYNLEPDQKSFTRSAQTNFLFLLLMLFALFASIVPVFCAATILKPSENCGPFRGLSTMYQAITKLIQSLPCEVQAAVDFFNSAAFVVPFIMFLFLALYGLYVQLRVKSSQYKVMTKQIQLEGADVRHLLQALNQQNRHQILNQQS